MYSKYLFFLILVIAHLSCANTTSINRNLNKLFSYCYENELFNGHVLVYRKGDLIFNKSYGKLSHNSPNKINENTAFRLASISKQFTAMAIVSLHSNGKLNYDDFITNYIKDFPYPKVTIRHLLNHTSGIPEYQDFLNASYKEIENNYETHGKVITNQSILDRFTHNKPQAEFTPGTGFSYSNTNYILLALLVESITDQTLASFMNETFFTPLNMKNTWVGDQKNHKSQQAQGYKKNHITNTYVENEVPPFLATVGDGGIFSSASDLLTWFKALNEGEFVNVEELEEISQQPIIGEEEGPYGFGWFIRKVPFSGNRALTHSGEFVGASNAIFRDLDANTTLIILSNNSNKIRSDLNSAIIKIMHGLPYSLPKLTAEALLSPMILEGEYEKAKAFFTRHFDNSQYDFSEKAFNKFGYNLLEEQKHKEAIEVFKWNIDLNPKSSNVYDSLAEAYLKFGDKQNALKYYKIAFEMDSKNKNAKTLIDQLSKN